MEDACIYLKFWDTTSVDLSTIAETPLPDEEQSSLVQDSHQSGEEELRSFTPFLRDAFVETKDRQVDNRDLFKIGTSFVEKLKKHKLQNLLRYLKETDQETALNVIFVLSDAN